MNMSAAEAWIGLVVVQLAAQRSAKKTSKAK